MTTGLTAAIRKQQKPDTSIPTAAAPSLTGSAVPGAPCVLATSFTATTRVTAMASFDTTNATQDATVSCGFNANLDVWYSYTPSMTGTASWTTCTLTTLDTVLSRFSACGGTQLQCLDDSCGLQTTISFPVTAGVPMLLRLAGYNNSQGSGSFTLSVTGGGGGPPNDNCANATNVGDGTESTSGSRFSNATTCCSPPVSVMTL